jgi:large subunit ribosomal protein L17
MAMLRNLVTSVLEHERVTTTDAKAKAVRPIAERIITYGKRGDLHSRRLALRIVRSPKVVGKVFDTVAKRFANRPGGYTRIMKLGRRQGDGAPLSLIELIPDEAARKAKAGAAKDAGKKGGKKKEAGKTAARTKAAKPARTKPAAEKAEGTKKPASPPAKKKSGEGQRKGRSSKG